MVEKRSSSQKTENDVNALEWAPDSKRIAFFDD